MDDVLPVTTRLPPIYLLSLNFVIFSNNNSNVSLAKHGSKISESKSFSHSNSIWEMSHGKSLATSSGEGPASPEIIQSLAQRYSDSLLNSDLSIAPSQVDLKRP